MLLHILRMYRRESGITLEVRAVEGEQMSHSMDFKYRRQVSIMDLNAAHFAGEKEVLPNHADAFSFCQ